MTYLSAKKRLKDALTSGRVAVLVETPDEPQVTLGPVDRVEDVAKLLADNLPQRRAPVGWREHDRAVEARTKRLLPVARHYLWLHR